ncbi:TipC family immunity protein [Streptococcus dentapri]
MFCHLQYSPFGLFIVVENQLAPRVLVSLSILLLTGFIALYVLNYQTRQKSANIFDEIYFVESSKTLEISHLGRIGFSKVDGLTSSAGGTDSIGRPIFPGSVYKKHSYYSNNLKKLRTLEIYTFYKGEEDQLYIFMSQNLSHGDTLDIAYNYDINTKVLSQKVMINFRGKNYRNYSENPTVVSKTLKANGWTLERASKYGDKILKEKVLKDWCSVYDSHYSPSHWGKVKVVNTWKNAEEE